MAELTEYSLAVLVSTLLIGGSAVTYATFANLETTSQADASLGALVSLALEALEHGHSSSTLLLPSSTVTCVRGTITLVSGKTAVSSSLPAACDFAVTMNGGAHVVTFDHSASGLFMEVT